MEVRILSEACSERQVSRDQFVGLITSASDRLDNLLKQVVSSNWTLEETWLELEHPKEWNRLKNNTKSLVENARSLAGKGQTARAIAELYRAIELQPDSMEAALARARCFMEQGNFACALVDAEFCLSQDTENTAALHIRCEASLACSDFDQAINDADRLLAPVNEHAQSTRKKLLLIRRLAVLGRCLFLDAESSDILTLRSACDEILKIAADNSVAIYIDALLDKQEGNVRLAEIKFEKLVETNPSFLAAKMRLAEIQIEKARPASIQRGVEICGEIAPLACSQDRSFLHCLEAEAEVNRGRPGAAILRWNAALDAFPKNSIALSRRGQIHTELGNFEQAKNDLAEAALYMDDPWVKWRSGVGAFAIFAIELEP